MRVARFTVQVLLVSRSLLWGVEGWHVKQKARWCYDEETRASNRVCGGFGVGVGVDCFIWLAIRGQCGGAWAACCPGRVVRFVGGVREGVEHETGHRDR